MICKSNFFRLSGALCLLLTLTVFAFSDTIRLKDGSIIKGKIVSFGNGSFAILVGEGTRQRQLNYTASEVESISFDGGATATAGVNNQSNPGNSTIITVGQKNQQAQQTMPPTIQPSVPKVVQTAPPVTAPATTATTSAPIATTATTTTAPGATTAPRPIQVAVKVLADNTANGWTNSGWVVRKGQKIRISGTGRISLGSGRYATPDGISSLFDKDKLMANEATGGLIAVIGDNNNEFIYIGEAREFTATRDGALFLGINEGNLADNSGAFDVKIEISPDSGD